MLAGCPVPGTGVTVTGTVSGDYFDITGDVTVTIARGDVSLSVPVPVASGSSTQIGAFLVANVPTGDYQVEITFENSTSNTGGTTYRVNGGAWVPVDSLPVTADETLEVYFGNVG
jgi:hypothetical protein